MDLNQVTVTWNRANEDFIASKENVDKTETFLGKLREKWNEANKMLGEAKERWNASMSQINKSKIGLQKATDELNSAQNEFKRTDAIWSSKAGDFSPSLSSVRYSSYGPRKEGKMECCDEIIITALISVASTVLLFALIGGMLYYFPEQNGQFGQMIQNSWSKLTGLFK